MSLFSALLKSSLSIDFWLTSFNFSVITPVQPTVFCNSQTISWAHYLALCMWNNYYSTPLEMSFIRTMIILCWVLCIFFSSEKHLILSFQVQGLLSGLKSFMPCRIKLVTLQLENIFKFKKCIMIILGLCPVLTGIKIDLTRLILPSEWMKSLTT